MVKRLEELESDGLTQPRNDLNPATVRGFLCPLQRGERTCQRLVARNTVYAYSMRACHLTLQVRQ
jgi:hypothetical protein